MASSYCFKKAEVVLPAGRIPCDLLIFRVSVCCAHAARNIHCPVYKQTMKSTCPDPYAKTKI